MGGKEPKLICSAPRCYLHAPREFLRACKTHLSVTALLSLNSVVLSIYFAPVQAGVLDRQRVHSRGQHTLSGKRQDFASGPKSLTIQMFGFLSCFSLLCVCAPICRNTEAELQHQTQQTHSKTPHQAHARTHHVMPWCTANARAGVAKEGEVSYPTQIIVGILKNIFAKKKELSFKKHNLKGSFNVSMHTY